MAKIGPVYVDEKYLNLDDPITKWNFLLKEAQRFHDEIASMLIAAIRFVIPDIKTYVADGEQSVFISITGPGAIFFDSDLILAEPGGGEDLEKNYKTLSQVITEAFPELDGKVFDDCIFLNRDQQEEVKGYLCKLKKGV